MSHSVIYLSYSYLQLGTLSTVQVVIITRCKESSSPQFHPLTSLNNTCMNIVRCLRAAQFQVVMFECLIFSGSRCETNINECEGAPCLNGATCLDEINNYSCSCSPGYEGRDCELNIDDCESAPCLNGGKCSDGVNMFTCDCEDTGFTGQTCQIDIDECEVAPCRHNSTRINLVNDYSCDCWPGYDGKNCSQDISDCLDSPCKNNATCYEYSNTTLYEIPDDLPAEIQPYFSAGFSYDKAAGRQCLCPAGYNGKVQC